MNYSVISGIQFWYKGCIYLGPLFWPGEEKFKASSSKGQTESNNEIWKGTAGQLQEFQKGSRTRASEEKIPFIGHLRPNSRVGGELAAASNSDALTNRIQVLSNASKAIGYNLLIHTSTICLTLLNTCQDLYFQKKKYCSISLETKAVLL